MEPLVRSLIRKPVKEDLTQIDELINPNINLPFGGRSDPHNHGGRAPFLVEAAAAGLLELAAMANRKKKKEEEEKKKTRRRKEKQSKTTNESITLKSFLRTMKGALGKHVGGLARELTFC